MPVYKPSDKLIPLEARVLKTIRTYAMLCPEQRVLVAVSGGADSTALLLCLHALSPILDCSLTVAHLNHCLRGGESDEDEAFVRSMSAGLGLPFESGTVDVKAKAVEAKQNLEQVGRESRYDFLRRTAEKTGAQKIAVGHNRNDQAETTLFRFLRGSGLEGLSAIHPVVDDRVIRPLLDCSRDDIIEYLGQRESRYREDSSNEELYLSRNRIRRELIPYLEEHFNPGLIRTLAREASLMREASSFIESMAIPAFEGMRRALNDGEDGIALRIEAMKALHPALQKQVLRCALKHCLGTLRGISAAHLEALLSLCRHSQSGHRIPLPRNAMAMRQFDELLLLNPAPESHDGFHYELDVPGHCHVPEARATFRAGFCETPEQSRVKDYSIRAFFEPSALRKSLIVRSRISGDRYGGSEHRKIKKMLIDRKIPLTERDTLPIVVSGDDVIWIPGFRPAKGYEARDPSQPFVFIEFNSDPA